MKYILKKDLPLAKAGTKVFVKVDNSPIATMYSAISTLGEIRKADIPEWLEEVKEPKTIYDLKEGDEYWTLELDNEVDSFTIENVNPFIESDNKWVFPTEREAKRNKLLRELATRTTKYLPKKGEMFMNLYGNTKEWMGSISNNFEYHCGVIFKDSEERIKYIGEEENNLLLHL